MLRRKKTKLAKVIGEFPLQRQQEIMHRLSNEINIRKSLQEQLYNFISISVTNDAAIITLDYTAFEAVMESADYEATTKAKKKENIIIGTFKLSQNNQ